MHTEFTRGHRKPATTKLWSSLLLLVLLSTALLAVESPPNPGAALPEQNGKFYSLSGKEVPW